MHTAKGMDAQVDVDDDGVTLTPRGLAGPDKRRTGTAHASWSQVRDVQLREPTPTRPGLLRVVTVGAPVGLPEVNDPWCVRFHARQAPAVRAVADVARERAAGADVPEPARGAVIVAAPRTAPVRVVARAPHDRELTWLYRLSVATLGVQLVMLLLPLLLALGLVALVVGLVIFG